jgi:hypothetical protein
MLGLRDCKIFAKSFVANGQKRGAIHPKNGREVSFAEHFCYIVVLCKYFLFK